MTRPEAEVCAEIFIQNELNDGLSRSAVPAVRSTLYSTCERFEGTIAKMGPNNMNRLFLLFYAVLASTEIKEMARDLGMNPEELAKQLLRHSPQEAINRLREEFPEDIDPEQEDLFKQLIDSIDSAPG